MSEELAAQTAEVMVSIESISAATQESVESSEETTSTAQPLAQDLNNALVILKIN